MLSDQFGSDRIRLDPVDRECYRVNILALDGKLLLAERAGLRFEGSEKTKIDTATFFGDAAAVNASLNSLQYEHLCPSKAATVQDTIKIRIRDQAAKDANHPNAQQEIEIKVTITKSSTTAVTQAQQSSAVAVYTTLGLGGILGVVAGGIGVCCLCCCGCCAGYIRRRDRALERKFNKYDGVGPQADKHNRDSRQAPKQTKAKQTKAKGKPAPPSHAPPPNAERVGDRKNKKAPGSSAPPPPSKPPPADVKRLPPGWQTARDDNGTTYYCNPSTGETSWDPPTSTALVAPPPPAPAASPQGAWQEFQDDNGSTYYYNEVTQETTWQKPKGFDGNGFHFHL